MISPRLQRAYRETRYVVDVAVGRKSAAHSADGLADCAALIRPTAIACIGRRSPDMDALLQRYGARSAVLITAWNPRSRPMPEGWNRRMSERLRRRLRRYATQPADGALRRWHEAHWLVLAPPAPMRRLGRMFRQNALVVVRPGQPARLVML